MAVTTTTPKDIKKAFGKALGWNDPGGGEGGSKESGDGEEGGGGGEEGSGGGSEASMPQSQQVILPAQNEWVMGQLP